jgi:hypothetical protein
MHNPSITTFNPLQPIVVRTIREAFDDVVQQLEQRRGVQAPPLHKDARAKLARHLVELARHGERDYDRLRMAALSSVPN